MTKVCYLCGKAIEEHEKESEDHVVPHQFIKRIQPKAKGFDYAGKLPTHEVCNNRFGPETYCQKAIVVLESLHRDDCIFKGPHPADPSIPIMALNSDCFPDFTERDLKYFKFIDVRGSEGNTLPTPEQFLDKPKTNPTKDALFTALSVLAKSAAAILVSRYIKEIPENWEILAVPYVGAHGVDFDALFGDTKPFEIGTKCWIKEMEGNQWFIAYKTEGVLVYFIFRDSLSSSNIEEIKEKFSDVEVLKFEGESLMKLPDYEWKKV